MTLKNKIIFGVAGFLFASGVIALTIVLATSGEELQSKAKSKTKIDVPKLSSNSFEVTGTQTLGTVNLKSDVILAKKVELKYFVGPDAPTNDNTYTTNKPATLKNGDIVYVKPFIKKASISSYAFKAKANSIKLVVSGLPLTAINSSFLTRDSFVISGVQTQGMIKKKNDVTLPSEVEARYFKGASATKLDESYKLSIINDLSNGDKVHIKFFIKNEYITTHKFADDFTNLLTLPINTLPKIEINSSLLVRESFLISGSESQGTIKKKARATLPGEVEIKYFKGNEAPEQDSAYELRVPTNLSNGDNVYIKFFIKSDYIATHKFASDFPNSISISVEGLKTLIDDRALTTSSFEFRNAPSKTIRWKSGATLPEQLVIKYYKTLSNTRPSSDNDYKTDVLANLSEGDHIYIKFFIKQEYKNTYKFASDFENFIHLEVKNNSFKSIINILNLKTSSFQTSGNNGTALVEWNDKMNLPSEVEIKYAKSNSEPISDSAYNSISPTNLSNNDIVYIKFFIKNNFNASHEFPSSGFENPVKFVVKGLKTLIDHRTLKKSSFAVTGTQGKGTIGWKVNSRELILPSQVEIRYYKGSIKPSGDNSYKTIPSLALSNNDLVHIKFFIKEKHTKTYEFASDFSNYILFEVRDLDKNEVDTASLVSNSFQATGAQGTGTMALKDAMTLPSEVEAKYYKGTIQPSSENSYQTGFPLALSNGEKIYIKFFIKSRFALTHKLPLGGFENPIQFVVSGLDKNEVDIVSLTSNSFEVTGTQGAGTMKLKDEITLPSEIEAKYYKGIDEPSSENSYQTGFPLALSNGEKIYIKFFIKSRFALTHKLPLGDFENPIQFVVSDLDRNEVATASLTSSSFEVTGGQGIGTMKLKDEITLPSEVEAKYYKGTIQPSNEGDYQTSSPSMLSNGDNIHIKFFIKSRFALTHKLPLGDFENPVQFVVSGLAKNEVATASLTSSSFEVTGVQGKGIMKLKDEITLPSEVEAKYYKGTTQPINEGDYQTRFPSILSNGDKVYIKFFIKSRFVSTHKLPLGGFENLVQFVVSGLDKNEVDTASLTSDSFEVIGTQGKGKMKLKDDVTLPSAVEVKYYKGTNSPGNEGDYQTSSPSMLSNGDKVYIKFFIKSRFIGYSKLPTNFTNRVLFKVSNLIVNNGKQVFQDSSGNIWGMKSGEPLKVLKKEGDWFTSSWISDTSQEGFLKDSKITNGRNGLIFEDSSGNIWAMGFLTPLQVLKKQGTGFASSWISDTSQEGLLNGSKITSGERGVIFEDSSGNIWAMGNGTPLQVLKKQGDGFASSWISDRTKAGLLNRSNIVDGWNGVIFQDSSGNIWAMGYETPLQVLKKQGDGFASSWISDTSQEGLLNGSKITNGQAGVIFQDSRGNIWAMGYRTPLQVLKKQGGGFASSWISDRTQAGLLNGSNIVNGDDGVIFEDSSGNIWAMGNGTPLQVLKKQGGGFASSWISDRTQEGLLNGSKITNGQTGVIFQDSSGNIWAMGYETPLQVLKKQGGGFASSWISDTSQEGLLNGFKITSGQSGVIFEDSSGNIWARGMWSQLQVLKKEGSGFVSSWTIP